MRRQLLLWETQRTVGRQNTEILLFQRNCFKSLSSGNNHRAWDLISHLWLLGKGKASEPVMESQRRAWLGFRAKLKGAGAGA